MYFQFLIEDRSTEILVDHVMKKMKHSILKRNLLEYKVLWVVSDIYRKGEQR